MRKAFILLLCIAMIAAVMSSCSKNEKAPAKNETETTSAKAETEPDTKLSEEAVKGTWILELSADDVIMMEDDPLEKIISGIIPENAEVTDIEFTTDATLRTIYEFNGKGIVTVNSKGEDMTLFLLSVTENVFEYMRDYDNAYQLSGLKKEQLDEMAMVKYEEENWQDACDKLFEIYTGYIEDSEQEDKMESGSYNIAGNDVVFGSTILTYEDGVLKGNKDGVEIILNKQ